MSTKKIGKKTPQKYNRNNKQYLIQRTEANIHILISTPQIHECVSYDISVCRRPTDFDTIWIGRRKFRVYNKIHATECLYIRFQIQQINKLTNKQWPHSYLCAHTHSHNTRWLFYFFPLFSFEIGLLFQISMFVCV